MCKSQYFYSFIQILMWKSFKSDDKKTPEVRFYCLVEKVEHAVSTIDVKTIVQSNTVHVEP